MALLWHPQWRWSEEQPLHTKHKKFRSPNHGNVDYSCPERRRKKIKVKGKKTFQKLMYYYSIVHLENGPLLPFLLLLFLVLLRHDRNSRVLIKRNFLSYIHPQSNFSICPHYKWPNRQKGKDTSTSLHIQLILTWVGWG